MELVLDCVRKTGYAPHKLFYLGTVGLIGMTEIAEQVSHDKYRAWLVDGKLDKDMVRFFKKLRRVRKGA
mgnify:CR=1 FL=1